MPSFMDYKTAAPLHTPQAAPTLSSRLRQNALTLLESTWSADPYTRKCYLYDCSRDDQPALNGGMTYDNTTKLPLEAKFFSRSCRHAGHTHTEYEVCFRPSQTTPGFYEETFGPSAAFPAGLYLDIPDEQGLYHKWILCGSRQEATRTIHSILPCNYEFLWVYGGERFRMWGFSRLRNRFPHTAAGEGQPAASGVQPAPEVRGQAFLPRTGSAALLSYGQRLIVSDQRPQPLAWEISGVDSIHPTGILKLTLSPVPYNAATDYTDPETGEMWAGLLSQEAPPIPAQPPELDPPYVLSCTSKSIKIGGSPRSIRLSPRSITSSPAQQPANAAAQIAGTAPTPASAWPNLHPFTDRPSTPPDGTTVSLSTGIIWQFTIDGLDVSSQLEITPQDNASVNLRIPPGLYPLTNTLLTIRAANFPSHPLTLRITSL